MSIAKESGHNAAALGIDKFAGASSVEVRKSDEQFNDEFNNRMIKFINTMNDKALPAAERALASRQAMEFHVNHIKRDWMDWKEKQDAILTDFQQGRMAIERESRLILSAVLDVRKFFLGDAHEQEVKRLREVVELMERLQALQKDGTLDKFADVLLKLS